MYIQNDRCSSRISWATNSELFLLDRVTSVIGDLLYKYLHPHSAVIQRPTNTRDIKRVSSQFSHPSILIELPRFFLCSRNVIPFSILPPRIFPKLLPIKEEAA